jgi:hypothetical protein
MLIRLKSALLCAKPPPAPIKSVIRLIEQSGAEFDTDELVDTVICADGSLALIWPS